MFQLPELAQFSVGLMHIQLLHTSASLAINENWDPDVRDDMEMMLNRIVPEDLPFRHSCEGPDDMVCRYSVLTYHLHLLNVTKLNSLRLRKLLTFGIWLHLVTFGYYLSLAFLNSTFPYLFFPYLYNK